MVLGRPGSTLSAGSSFGRFSGSVYAPNANVTFSIIGSECSDHSTIVPREIGFAVVKSASFYDMITVNFPSNSQTAQPVETILSWVN